MLKKTDTKIARCFWGITRSLKLTLPSIEEYIFKPLKKANILYDIYIHTYIVSDIYSNPRAGEASIKLDNNEYKLLNPYKYSIEDQNSIDASIQFNKYELKGDPWKKYNSYDNYLSYSKKSFYNHIRALRSLKQVTCMWQNNSTDYSHIVYCRPDVTYITPFNISWLSSSNSIYIPNFGRYGKNRLKLNDRFAIGRPEQMKIYGNRFNEALQYSKKHQLHSETFLADILKKNKIHIKFIEFGFIRTRANGNLADIDIKELVQKRWYTRKQANRVQRAYTRKVRILSTT